jgi:hypothetical protein
MNKQSYQKIKMLSVKFYRNLKKKLFYGIYFNKFHTICKEKFKKCDHRMAKEVNKEVKKKLQHQCPAIKYYENTKYALNKGNPKKSAQLSWIFFPRN